MAAGRLPRGAGLAGGGQRAIGRRRGAAALLILGPIALVLAPGLAPAFVVPEAGPRHLASFAGVSLQQAAPAAALVAVAPSRCREGVATQMQAMVNLAAVRAIVPGAPPWALGFGVLAVVALLVQRVKVWLETPSRPYNAAASSNSVRSEYDTWTREGVLEHYWGEHIHMGSYTPLGKQTGYNRNDPLLVAAVRATFAHLFGGLKDFKEAKLDFSKEMLEWSGAKAPKKILDVGCGIGGTSRFLAKAFPEAEVVGITLSPEQVRRGTELAKEAGLSNVRFQVTDALNMTFADNTFDLVWGCESGEHMPDKQKYIEEMSRVCKPGGNVVVATWCERDPDPPFNAEERTTLNFLYEEWSHPYFISYNKYAELMRGTGVLEKVETDDWTERTLPSWRHSVWVGVWSPWFWLKTTLGKPKAFLGFCRDAYTLERYHRGMRRGLLHFGMIKGVKIA